MPFLSRRRRRRRKICWFPAARQKLAGWPVNFPSRDRNRLAGPQRPISIATPLTVKPNNSNGSTSTLAVACPGFESRLGAVRWYGTCRVVGRVSSAAAAAAFRPALGARLSSRRFKTFMFIYRTRAGPPRGLAWVGAVERGAAPRSGAGAEPDARFEPQTRNASALRAKRNANVPRHSDNTPRVEP